MGFGCRIRQCGLCFFASAVNDTRRPFGDRLQCEQGAVFATETPSALGCIRLFGTKKILQATGGNFMGVTRHETPVSKAVLSLPPAYEHPHPATSWVLRSEGHRART